MGGNRGHSLQAACKRCAVTTWVSVGPYSLSKAATDKRSKKRRSAGVTLSCSAVVITSRKLVDSHSATHASSASPCKATNGRNNFSTFLSQTIFHNCEASRRVSLSINTSEPPELRVVNIA